MSTEKRGIIIPAYYPMWNEAGKKMFEEIFTYKDLLSKVRPDEYHFMVVINPDSGPGKPASDLLAGYEWFLTECRNRKISVFGYIHCTYGSRPVKDLKTEANQYVAYGVRKFFIDEAPSKQSTYLDSLHTILDRYRTLELEQSGVITQIYNAGTSATVFNDFISSFENTVGIIFEGPGSKIYTLADLGYHVRSGALMYGVVPPIDIHNINPYVDYSYVTVLKEHQWSEFDDSYFKAILSGPLSDPTEEKPVEEGAVVAPMVDESLSIVEDDGEPDDDAMNDAAIARYEEADQNVLSLISKMEEAQKERSALLQKIDAVITMLTTIFSSLSRSGNE
jgi:hypothetical protein